LATKKYPYQSKNLKSKEEEIEKYNSKKWYKIDKGIFPKADERMVCLILKIVSTC
jgi:hypothetical protein